MFDTVAVIGATGAVGRIMLQLLEERAFEANRFRLLASARSAGTSVPFRGGQLVIEELTHDSFDGVDLVLSSTPDDVAAEYLPSAVAAGATVIVSSHELDRVRRLSPRVVTLAGGTLVGDRLGVVRDA